MEGLKELVAASLARHGIECPVGDSQLVWGRGPAQACPTTTSIPAEPTLTTALPDHNYKISSQKLLP